VRIPSAERRDLLLAAALRVMAREGVAAATTRAIVREAGMSLASFHYAFDSRDEMMRALMAQVVDATRDAAEDRLRLEGEVDIRTALRDGLRGYLDHLLADPEHEQVLQELSQYALRTPGLDVLARELVERYHDTAAELLERGAQAAGIAWSVPVRQVARMVVTITDGITLTWLADRDTAAAERVLDFAADAISRLAVPVARREPVVRA
jgi:AcrR family transcriptional regulator